MMNTRGQNRRNAAAPSIDAEDVNTRRLPPQLRQLVRVLGRLKAFELVERLGGTVVLVPTRVRPQHASHHLFELLGPQAFAALVQVHGGQVLQLPKYDSVARQARHDHARGLLNKGLTIAEVALRSGYTMRHVHNIKAAAIEDQHLQADLFADWFEQPQAEPQEAPLPSAHNPFPGVERG